MNIKFRNTISKINTKLLSSLASFALVITTIAANQRCWYVLHEEKLPEGSEKLRKH